MIKKRGIYLLIGFFILASLIFVIGVGVDTKKPYHSSSNVTIGIDGLNKTINEIIAGNFVFPSHLYSRGVKVNPGHSINETWVSVKDGEMTLYQALSSANKLCPASPVKTTYSSSPLDKSQPFHYASEINLSSGKTLQEAINAGDLCYYWNISSSCSATCGGGTNLTYCSHNGVQVADTYCYAPKPSKSCNTQGCVWVIDYRSCMPSSCGGGCPDIAGDPCSPAGSTKFCCVDYGCGAAGSLGIRFICK